MNDVFEPAEGTAARVLRHVMRPLDGFLGDPSTQDVAMQEPNVAWIFAKGMWRREEVPLSLDNLEEIAILAASQRRMEMDFNTPLCPTTLPNGERFQGCFPPTVPDGSVAITIRKPERGVAPVSAVGDRYDIDGWNVWSRQRRGGRGYGDLLQIYRSGDIEAFLNAAARERLNILFVGRVGSGKTSLARTLTTAIPQIERVITIEDSEEFEGLPPNTIRHLFARDDDQRPSPRMLLETASLRERPDRVLLQELRGPEAWTFLQISMAFPGSLSTIHGDSAPEGFFRLFSLIKADDDAKGMDDDTIRAMISSAVDIIMPLEASGGRHAIRSTWFIGDAEERGQSAADLLRAG